MKRSGAWRENLTYLCWHFRRLASATPTTVGAASHHDLQGTYFARAETVASQADRRHKCLSGPYDLIPSQGDTAIFQSHGSSTRTQTHHTVVSGLPPAQVRHRQPRDRQRNKPVDPKACPLAFTPVVCVEIFRHLDDLRDKLAFSSAFPSARQASKDRRAWSTCAVSDFMEQHGKTLQARLRSAWPLKICK